MSCLVDKSNFNLEAASVLIENDLYAPSVHCSYYSVFQKIKYEYKQKENISEDELRSRAEASRKNSHVFLIDSYCLLIRDVYIARKLKRKIIDLKTFRNESDYQELVIGYDKSNSALNKCKEILSQIKKIN